LHELSFGTWLIHISSVIEWIFAIFVINKISTYKNYNLSKNDEVDIISTNNSVYGYFAVSGGFELKYNFGSFSTHVRSNVGANNGNKIQKGEKFFIKDLLI